MSRKLTENLSREVKRVREESRRWLPIWQEEVTDRPKPKTRADCDDVPRPCPFVSCKFNLYLDVHPDRPSITYNFPGREPDEVPKDRSCALDIAERGGVSLLDVAKLTNLTRERVRQVQLIGLGKVMGNLTEFVEDADDRTKPLQAQKSERSHLDRKEAAPIEDDDSEDNEHRDESDAVSFFDRSARASRLVRARVYRIYTREIYEKGFESRPPPKPQTMPKLKF